MNDNRRNTDLEDDLEHDERSISGLMATLRDYTLRVSSSFVDRVSEELERSAAESGPGMTSFFGGLLVQMLNLLCDAIGAEAETDPLDTKDQEREEKP